MPTTNSATLLNEVTFYQSQQHLLCFEKLHHKHGEAYYLPSIMPTLGHRGFGPQRGNHRTRILSRSLSQNSPTISLSFRHSLGDGFSLPRSYFFRMWCSTLLAKHRCSKSQGKAHLTWWPFSFLSEHQDSQSWQWNSRRLINTKAHPLCLSKVGLPYLKGLLRKQNEVTKESTPCTGIKE